MDIYLFLEYLFLGLLQGFTEPLPISSSAHVFIFERILNSADTGLLFEIIVNFGSLIAIFFIFRKTIFTLISHFFNYLKTKEKEYFTYYKYSWLIVIGTLPGVIAGFLFKDTIEGVLANTKTIGIALLITALALYIIRGSKGEKSDENITFKDALLIGLFQAVALVPGISRSGATIVAGILLGLKRETAFRFSFMLYIPISIGSLVLGILKPTLTTDIIYYIIGFISSMVMTYFSTQLFINIMKKGKLIYFSIYCVILGIITILFI